VSVGQALVLTVQVANFSTAHANVTSGHVRRGVQVTKEFCHEGLAKTADFCVRLAFGIKVGSPLAPTHGETGKGVFKDLLET
jgi:hypothetical protein